MGKNNENQAKMTAKARPRLPKRLRYQRDPRDLRRRTLDAREIADRCVERASLLDVAQRAAVVAVYRDGMTVKELAALHRQHKADPRLLGRRLRVIRARLCSAKFEYVRTFLEPSDPAERSRLGLLNWPPLRKAVAERRIAWGWTIRNTAASLGVSKYVVRKEMDVINAHFDAWKARRR